jgi:hypothetical protein
MPILYHRNRTFFNGILTIGIILCADKDKVAAEYALGGQGVEHEFIEADENERGRSAILQQC